MIIGDLTEEEARGYLKARLGINEKRLAIKNAKQLSKVEEDVKQLYELVGGRINHLRMYSDKIIGGKTFEGRKYILLQ